MKKSCLNSVFSSRTKVVLINFNEVLQFNFMYAFVNTASILIKKYTDKYGQAKNVISIKYIITEVIIRYGCKIFLFKKQNNFHFEQLKKVHI